MENATTIRSEIEKELKLGGYTFNSFGQATGLNRGILVQCLTGIRLSLSPYDKWT